jgi:hypothetical protein
MTNPYSEDQLVQATTADYLEQELHWNSVDRDTISHLFHHNAVVVLGNGQQAKIGSITSRWGHFHEWKRLTACTPAALAETRITIWRANAVTTLSVQAQRAALRQPRAQPWEPVTGHAPQGPTGRATIPGQSHT